MQNSLASLHASNSSIETVVKTGVTGTVTNTINAPITRARVEGALVPSTNLLDPSLLKTGTETYNYKYTKDGVEITSKRSITRTYDPETQTFTLNSGTDPETGEYLGFWSNWGAAFQQTNKLDIKIDPNKQYRIIVEYSGYISASKDTPEGTTPNVNIYLGQAEEGQTNYRNFFASSLSGNNYSGMVSGTFMTPNPMGAEYVTDSDGNTTTNRYTRINSIWLYIQRFPIFKDFKFRISIVECESHLGYKSVTQWDPYGQLVPKQPLRLRTRSINLSPFSKDFTSNLIIKQFDPPLKAGVNYNMYLTKVTVPTANTTGQIQMSFRRRISQYIYVNNSIPLQWFQTNGLVHSVCPTADTDEVTLYTIPDNYGSSAGANNIATLADFRVYEEGTESCSRYVEPASTEFMLDYRLTEGEYVEYADDKVILHRKDSVSGEFTDIDISEEYLESFKSLRSFDPTTVVENMIVDVRALS